MLYFHLYESEKSKVHKKLITSCARMKAVTSRRPGRSVKDQPLERVTKIKA